MEACPRISIVDDDPSVRRALGRLCKSAGFQVETYESAESFVEANSHDIDCLILDVHLPGESGLELQARLKKADLAFPVIFVTAYENEEVRSLAIDAGARDFLRKPLDSERLLDVIQQILDQSGD